MTDDKKNISAAQWGAIATIAAALIGLCGVLAASCISDPEACGFAKSPTLTPIPETTVPVSYTLMPPMFTLTDTVTPIVLVPTSTTMDTPTPTPIDTPTPIIKGFVGTWINVYETPPTFGLQYALFRLEISMIDPNTAKVTACRCDTSECKSKIQLDPKIALATLQDNSLSFTDADKFYLAEHLTWKITIRKDNTLLLVTIEEELPDGSKNNANIQMKSYTDPLGGLRSACVSPVFTIP